MSQEPYQNPHYPAVVQTQPKPKRKWKLKALIVVIAAIVVIAIATGGKAVQGQHTVVYTVTGTGPATSITYTTDGMTTTSTAANAELPWTKTLLLPSGESLQVVSILAQGGGKGSTQVKIEVDGKVYKEASADGYNIAAANGTIGALG